MPIVGKTFDLKINKFGAQLRLFNFTFLSVPDFPKNYDITATSAINGQMN
jgi:hypothetical protein